MRDDAAKELSHTKLAYAKAPRGRPTTLDASSSGKIAILAYRPSCSVNLTSSDSDVSQTVYLPIWELYRQ